MPQVEVKFSAHSGQHNAKPGDTKKVDAADVAGLVNSGVAEPVSKAEEAKAKA
jgi:hypothetical protein